MKQILKFLMLFTIMLSIIFQCFSTIELFSMLNTSESTKSKDIDLENRSVANPDPENKKSIVNFPEMKENFMSPKAVELEFVYSSKSGGSETITLYNPETLASHTYITALGYLMEYLGNNQLDSNYVDVRFQGSIYAIEKADVSAFLPLSSIKSFPHYINISGKVRHYIEGNPLAEDNWYLETELGNAPSWMIEGKPYYSFSGIYFTDKPEKLGQYNQSQNAVNSNEPYYDYYLYQPLRTKTAYTSEELNKAFEHFYYNSSFGNRDSILINQASSFLSAESKFGTNALMVLSIGIHEGAYGTSEISISKNNPFGYAAYDSNTSSAKEFGSVKEAIDYVSGDYLSWVHADPTSTNGRNYYGAHFGNKGSGINVKYASDPFWGEKNANMYAKVDRYLGGKDYQKYGLAIVAQESGVYLDSFLGNKLFQYKRSTSLLTYMYPVVLSGVNNDSVEVNLEPPFDEQYNIEWNGKYRWGSKGYINIKDAMIINQKKDANVVTQGNRKYYLNENGTIKYANEYVDGKKVKAIWYSDNTQFGQHQNKEKYVYFLFNDGSGKISYMNEYSSGKKVKATWYEKDTIVGKHQGKEKYAYFLFNDGSGKISYMNEYVNGKKVKATWYEKDTIVGKHQGKEKYIYFLFNDGSGRISYMNEYFSGKKIKATWYIKDTVIGKHVGKEERTQVF